MNSPIKIFGKTDKINLLKNMTIMIKNEYFIKQTEIFNKLAEEKNN